jgi:hypothetical protein
MTDCAFETTQSQVQPYLRVVLLCSYPVAAALHLVVTSNHSSQRASGTDLPTPSCRGRCTECLPDPFTASAEPVTDRLLSNLGFKRVQTPREHTGHLDEHGPVLVTRTKQKAVMGCMSLPANDSLTFNPDRASSMLA